MIAIRAQPTGELIPGIAVVLGKESSVGKDEHEDAQVPVFAFATRAIIGVDETVGLVTRELSTLPSDTIIVRSVVKTIRIF